MDHYCEAFFLQSQQCFRLIHSEDCPYLTQWRGRFKDATGKWHTVVSCDGHRADLDAVQRIA